MKPHASVSRVLAVLTLLMISGPAAAATFTPRQIIDKVLELDLWGSNGIELQGTAALKDKKGRERVLVFESLSVNYKGTLSKRLLKFISPPDLTGAKFLQIQNDSRDDDRFLYLPELKRSRRVAAGQRSSAFMGTDFNFADLDQRDLREGKVEAMPDAKVGKFDCFRVAVIPSRSDSPYSRIEYDVRKDNFIFVKIRMYDKAKVHIKTLTTHQIKRVSGRWFVTKSLMENLRDSHSTLLLIGKIKIPDKIADSNFTQQNLEK